MFLIVSIHPTVDIQKVGSAEYPLEYPLDDLGGQNNIPKEQVCYSQEIVGSCFFLLLLSNCQVLPCAKEMRQTDCCKKVRIFFVWLMTLPWPE